MVANRRVVKELAEAAIALDERGFCAFSAR